MYLDRDFTESVEFVRDLAVRTNLVQNFLGGRGETLFIIGSPPASTTPNIPNLYMQHPLRANRMFFGQFQGKQDKK